MSYCVQQEECFQEEEKTYVPRFVLPDFMVRMRVKELEALIAADKEDESLLNEHKDCKEHLLLQERLCEGHSRTGALSSVAFMLHGLMISSDHSFFLDYDCRLKNSDECKSPRKRMIPQQADQLVGNMMNNLDQEYFDASEVRRKHELMSLAGNIVKPEFDASSSNAYHNAQAVYQYYKDVHNRDSINDRHLKLVSSVHFGHQYANAFWTPLGLQMVYGDGNPALMRNATESLDIVARQLTHGIVDQECSLEYEGESGALNESIADVFGLMVTQWKDKQSASQSDWVIGAGTVPQWGNGLRCFTHKCANRFDIQPKTYVDIEQWKIEHAEELEEDRGGVHLLSGIPSHAFYRFCMSFKGEIFKAYDSLPAKIWYAVVVGGEIRRNTNFYEFAALTLQKALELGGSEVAENLKQSWAEVGIYVNFESAEHRRIIAHA